LEPKLRKRAERAARGVRGNPSPLRIKRDAAAGSATRAKTPEAAHDPKVAGSNPAPDLNQRPRDPLDGEPAEALLEATGWVRV
jgi:hypothetical protein